MRKIRKIAAVLIAGLLLTMAACGSAGKESTEETAGTDQVSESVSDASEDSAENTAAQEDTTAEDSTEAAEETPEETDPAETKTWTIDVGEQALPGTAAEDVADEDMPRLYDSSDLGVDSRAYCVLDQDGNVVIGRKELKAYAPASITKVLTALVVLDHYDLSTPWRLSQSSLEENMEPMSSGVQPSLKPDEVMTVGDLLYALILQSTNAAGNVLAELVAGSVPAFAEMMNKKCEELGLTHSHFVNAHGLDAEGHYTCAYDMAVILKAAMENETLRTIMSTLNYTIPGTAYTGERQVFMNHRMLGNDLNVPGVFAGKPGWTVNAQSTLLTAVERDGKTLYVCTLHSDDGCHYLDTQNIIEYAYARISGGYPHLEPVVHNVMIRNADPTGIDLFFVIDNPAKSAQIVYWSLLQGTASAIFGEEAPAKSYMGVHISFPTQGPYAVQIFVTPENGERQMSMVHVLYTGQMNPEGIVTWDGNPYVIDEYGLLRVGGSVELKSGMYCTNANGVVQTGFTGRYYVEEIGKIKTGWIDAEGVRCYAQGDGKLATGKIMIDGVVYEFNSYGALLGQE